MASLEIVQAQALGDRLSAVASYTLGHCTIPAYQLYLGGGGTLDVQATLACQSLTAQAGGSVPTLGKPSAPVGPTDESLAFAAGDCPAPDCPATVDVSAFSLSLTAPTTTAASSAPQEKAAVSLAAAWAPDEAVSLDLMRMAPQQVLATLGAEVKGRAGPVGSFTFGACTVPGSVLGMTSFQATFDCQSVTAQLGGPPATTTAAACGANLITNPGAEAGPGARSDVVVPVPGWKPTGSFTAAQYAWGDGDLSAKTPGPADRGKNYFHGGPSSETSTGTQMVALPASFSGSKATYVLSGWLGGWDGQDDNATLFVTWEDAHGQPLAAAHRLVTGFPTGLSASAQIGPVTQAQRDGTTELVYRQASGAVPAGTRLVKVVLVMQGPDGADNDGLADNLSLVLSCS